MPVSSCSQSHSNPERSSSPRRIDEQRVFYGDTANDEILDRTSDMIGVQHWAQEGITGRGVLIDYVSWAEKQGIKYSALSCHSIGLCDILDIAVEQNVSFKRGDILLIRCGFTKEWDGMSLEAKKSYAELETPEHAGIEATTAVLEWICNTGLAAVAGDAVSFEVLPPTADFMLHEYLIAGWGMPIGESGNLLLWYLRN